MLSFTIQTWMPDAAKKAAVEFDTRQEKAVGLATEAAQRREAVAGAATGRDALKAAGVARGAEFDALRARVAALQFGQDETVPSLRDAWRAAREAEAETRAKLKADHLEALGKMLETRHLKPRELRQLATRRPSRAMAEHRKGARENVRQFGQSVEAFGAAVEAALLEAQGELERLAARL